MLHYLVFVGAAVNLFGHFSYIKETLKGNTKPNKVTWLIWSIAPLIATFAAISSGVKWGGGRRCRYLQLAFVRCWFLFFLL